MLSGQKCILDLIHTLQTLKFSYNHFHSQQVMLKGYNMTQRSVLSQKFLARNEHYFKKRKKENSQIKPLASVSSIFGSENPTITTRRMERLNKIFMDKISETLLSSQYASPLMKIGFEITQIKVQHKLSSIHIYWYYSQNTDEEELNRILLELSIHLRTELNSQHILGRIPPILFVKDLTRHNSIEVDKRLKIADFGPDETTDDPVLDDTVDNLSMIAKSDDVKYGFPDNVIKIRQDVLGVNREKIMKSVMKKCKESKGLHRLTGDHIPSSYTSHQIETEKPYLPNFPVHARTKEIQKWASQFKKERKSLLKKQKYADQHELMLLSEGEQNEDPDFEIEIKEEFEDENLYEQDHEPDNKY